MCVNWVQIVTVDEICVMCSFERVLAMVHEAGI